MSALCPESEVPKQSVPASRKSRNGHNESAVRVLRGMLPALQSEPLYSFFRMLSLPSALCSYRNSDLLHARRSLSLHSRHLRHRLDRASLRRSRRGPGLRPALVGPQAQPDGAVVSERAGRELHVLRGSGVRFPREVPPGSDLSSAPSRGRWVRVLRGHRTAHHLLRAQLWRHADQLGSDAQRGRRFAVHAACAATARGGGQVFL